MFSLVEAIADVNGADEKIVVADKGEGSLRRRFEFTTDDRGAVDSRNRGGDVQVIASSIEEFNSDTGMRAGCCILQNRKQQWI